MSGVGGFTICVFCRYFNSEAFEESSLSRKCKAFEDRIPGEIWAGEVDHRKPYEGDNGIHFEFQEDTSQLSWPLKDIPLEHAKKLYKFSVPFVDVKRKDE